MSTSKEHSAEAAVSLREYTNALVQFCMSSVGMMLGNKLAVVAFPLPCSLVIIQTFGTLALMTFCRAHLEMISIGKALQWIPIACLFTSMLFTSLKSFVYVNVSTVLIFRNVGAIITTVVEYYVRGETFNTEIVFSELTILLGAVMYGFANATFNWEGLFWILANVLSQVAYGVIVKDTMTRKPQFSSMSKYTMSLYNNVLALPLLFVVLVLQGEVPKVPAKLSALTLGGCFWIAATCALGFMISTSGFGLQKLVSATKFLIINNVVKFFNILLGVVILGDRMGVIDGAGCIIAILAGMWYSSAQMRHSQKQRERAEAAAAAVSSGKLPV